GWEQTPKVRLAILDPGHEDILNREEENFPLERQQFRKLYLDASSSTLNEKNSDKEAQISYTPNEKGTSFTLTFNQDTEITGYMKLKLWVAAKDADDMDIFTYVRKLDSNGNVLPMKVVTDRYHEGASGRLRVSLRQLDEATSTPECPRHTFKKQEKLNPNQIVPIEIGLWPMGMKWHTGEQLELLITGVELLKRPEFPDMPAEPTINEGKHIIYTGGKYDSYLLVPIIPSVSI
ncbi:CocE/NonD family hydrolase C-terminal non-catalytic domain-containing protein, partial [Priestia megaterium]